MVIDNQLIGSILSTGDAYHAQEEIKDLMRHTTSQQTLCLKTYVLNNYSYYLALRKRSSGKPPK